MAAGGSARDEARRSRDRAERLVRRAELFEQGASGELETAQVLEALGPEWATFHDCRWPGRRYANIDHVVVGPGGIFVIDSKNWTGDITVDRGALRQNGRSRERAVANAADASLAVAELAGPDANLVRPVLCFVGNHDLAGSARDVLICSTSNLVRMLGTREEVLDADGVVEAATRLEARLVQRPAPRTESGDLPATNPHEDLAVAVRSAPARGSRRSPKPRSGSRRTGDPSLRRLFAFLVGVLVLLAAIPTVIPWLGTLVASLLVNAAAR